MQQTKKFKMADAISPYLAVSCGLMTIHSVCWRLGFWEALIDILATHEEDN